MFIAVYRVHPLPVKCKYSVQTKDLNNSIERKASEQRGKIRKNVLFLDFEDFFKISATFTLFHLQFISSPSS